MDQPPSPPPLPPSPPPPPDFSGPAPTRPSRPLAYVGAFVLLAIAAAPQLLLSASDPESDGAAYRIGRVIGAAMLGLVIAYFVWWLSHRSQPAGRRWSPWVVVIAAGMTLFMTLPLLVSRGARALAERTPHEGPASDYFVEPDGYTLRSPPSGAVEAARQGLVADPAVQDAIADLDIREAVVGGTPRGGVAVLLLDAPPEVWDEMKDGFVRGFEGSGNVDLTASTIDGVDAMIGGATGSEIVVLFDKNVIVLIGGNTKDVADEIAAAHAQAFD